MLQSNQIEELLCLVSALDREALVEQFHCYRASFPLDFSREFLEKASLDRLRHIFVAICLQSQQMPHISKAA
jgi:hypothetical protein